MTRPRMDQVYTTLARWTYTALFYVAVPLILVNGKPSVNIVDGRLSDLAPSVLEMLGIIKPVEMTGKSLLR